MRIGEPYFRPLDSLGLPLRFRNQVFGLEFESETVDDLAGIHLVLPERRVLLEFRRDSSRSDDPRDGCGAIEDHEISPDESIPLALKARSDTPDPGAS